MLQTTEETELTMPSDFRWHSFLVSAGYLPDTFNMTKDEEIRMINEKLDFYVMEASDEEALKDFWDYCEERQREERIIAEMKING